MGIRFDCPNGHHLHVKAFLAGRRGFCPDCGVRLQIPTQSQPQSDAAEKTDVRGAAHESGVVDIKIERTRLNTDPRRRGSARRVRRQASAPLAIPVSAGGDVALSEVPQPPPGATTQGTVPATTGVGQPEGDNAWYVRPPAGGQYGPASDATLAQWIREGRIVRDTYVWRGGWPNWQMACDVADRLPAKLPPAVQPMPNATDEGDAAVGDKATVTHLEILNARRRARRRQWLAAMGLFVLVIVLSGLLIWVLKSGVT